MSVMFSVMCVMFSVISLASCKLVNYRMFHRRPWDKIAHIKNSARYTHRILQPVKSRIGLLSTDSEKVHRLYLSHKFLLLMDVLTEYVGRDVPGSMMFADDIVLCGDDETDMTEYLDTWRSALKDRGMRISSPKTQFIDFKIWTG